MSDEPWSRPSKTRRKRDALALRDLTGRLARLPLAQLRRLNLPDPIRDEFVALAGFESHGARRRQLQRIARFLRELPTEESVAIGTALERLHAPDARARALQHEAEHWRDALLAADPGDALPDALLARCPDLDGPAVLAQLAEARDSVAARRVLFRMLHAALQAPPPATS